MKATKLLGRRMVLRGLGSALVLPMLGSLPSVAGASTAARSPKRLSIFYLPNGMRMDSFRPKSVGADYEMSTILEPLAPWKEQFSVVTGLAHNNANALGDPGGAHGRSCAAYLTGAHPKPTEGSDLYCGVSMDQLAASRIGATTPFPSLELGIEPSSLLGSCDIGFSCTYTNTISWRTPTQALPVMVNPRDVFERLFGDTAGLDEQSRTAQFNRRSSILDYVQRDAKRLATRLARNDQYKLDQYLNAVREVERRIQQLNEKDIAPSSAEFVLPAGIPEDFQTHVRLMIDLQVLAMQTDLTRVSTFMLGRELSNRAYPEIGVADSHHSLSHHGGDTEKLRKLIKISRFHWQQFGYLLQKLADTPEGEGSLLDSTLVMAGASLGESNDHDCMDLPALIAGRGIASGRHFALPDHTPMSNLMLTLLQKLGLPIEAFGDSTGNIEDILS